ncbi:MAG: DNA polymerase/3'-5' exonuclease PolX [Atribacterota bacterium]|nr:DNA polymerase/3'-5' exonuclease PolX [Atribacterota bacterium]
MTNTEISNIFKSIVKILKIQDENRFKIRAYERIVDTIENLPEEIEVIYKEGRLKEVPGIGDAIAKKIVELIETGNLEYFENLKNVVPVELLELLDVPEIGPRKAKLFYEKMGINNIHKLEQAALEHKLQNLPGMGEKTEENILKGIQLYKKRKRRVLLNTAMLMADKIIKQLTNFGHIEKISIAGSLRRQKESIGDIDILVASEEPEKIIGFFTNLPDVKEVLAEGKTKSAILTKEDLHVDLRVVSLESFGAALQYFTGSKEHNVRLREMAVRKGFKINEYGLFQISDDKKIAGREESDIYHKLGLAYIMPELREDRGELEAGLNNNLPDLINASDIKGDLHIHSMDSDGVNTIEEIVNAAKEMGYQYIAITDHTQSLQIAGGLKEERLEEQIYKIDKINHEQNDVFVLKGAEVDIKNDGSLDLPDEVLKKLDLVIAAIHTGLKQEKEQIMKRLSAAMQNPYVNILAHPTGRIIGFREPYELDLQKLIQLAADTNTVLEINSSPERMDLNDINVKNAKKLNIKFAINTDAHQIKNLKNITNGISVARRGWLEKKDIINTLPLQYLLTILNKKK